MSRDQPGARKKLSRKPTQNATVWALVWTRQGLVCWLFVAGIYILIGWCPCCSNDNLQVDPNLWNLSVDHAKCGTKSRPIFPTGATELAYLV